MAARDKFYCTTDGCESNNGLPLRSEQVGRIKPMQHRRCLKCTLVVHMPCMHCGLLQTYNNLAKHEKTIHAASNVNRVDKLVSVEDLKISLFQETLTVDSAHMLESLSELESALPPPFSSLVPPKSETISPNFAEASNNKRPKPDELVVDMMDNISPRDYISEYLGMRSFTEGISYNYRNSVMWNILESIHKKFGEPISDYNHSASHNLWLMQLLRKTEVDSFDMYMQVLEGFPFVTIVVNVRNTIEKALKASPNPLVLMHLDNYVDIILQSMKSSPLNQKRVAHGSPLGGLENFDYWAYVPSNISLLLPKGVPAVKKLQAFVCGGALNMRMIMIEGSELTASNIKHVIANDEKCNIVYYSQSGTCAVGFVVSDQPIQRTDLQLVVTDPTKQVCVDYVENLNYVYVGCVIVGTNLEYMKEIKLQHEYLDILYWSSNLLVVRLSTPHMLSELESMQMTSVFDFSAFPGFEISQHKFV